MSRASVQDSYFEAAKRLLEAVADQDEALSEAASICTEAIAAGGLVHAFGCGHSRMAVEELFPRYGSYPGFHPLVELSLTYHTQVTGANGQRQAMFIERVSGLAESILANFVFAPTDAMLIVSAGGNNAVPVEMAAGARRRGLPVIAVTSLGGVSGPGSSGAPNALAAESDVVLDLKTPPGDGLVSVKGVEGPVGPGSTIAGAALVNELKLRVARELVARGVMPPVITSAAVVGTARSQELFEAAYDEHARRLAAAIAKPRGGEHA